MPSHLLGNLVTRRSIKLYLADAAEIAAKRKHQLIENSLTEKMLQQNSENHFVFGKCVCDDGTDNVSDSTTLECSLLRDETKI